MDLTKLKLEHPEVFAAAVQVGVEKERDRINAHLILGNESGDMETALKAVEDGSEMTASINAKYTAAAMRKTNVASREEDEVDTTEVPKEQKQQNVYDAIVDGFCARVGV